MAEITISESEIKNNLKSIILQLQKKEGIYFKEIQNLQRNFEYVKKEQAVQNYHASRFSFIKQGNYFRLNTGTKQSSKKLLNLYKKLSNVIQSIQKDITNGQFGEPINYIVYFQDLKGKLHRIQINEIKYKQVRAGSNALKLQQSQIKRLINEKERSDLITQHYENFVGALQGMYRGKDPLPNSVLNKGHLVEAFERHLQERHGGTLLNKSQAQLPFNPYEIWRQVAESKGNTPWYQQGDVGIYQVKNVTSGDVRLSSYNSLQDLFNFLKYLIQSPQDINKKVESAYSILITATLKNETILSRVKQYAGEQLAEQLQKMLNKA